ncbi:protein rolling stone isoform X1 [Malaya genurostris]|uniref:protein rolling stone isoform X1 n=1 Tax=Malaya genurostris TaxID=325434 RepID=UPI0026F3B253|nr:protein rolling stone isoform X1 [Malaya genurostris]XP_058447104.1 protein rolling stone isoform X1 [Malaya genurostris]XP_058447105.1 protein rolling stone isoform X1 [Malaya genurostris]XP_058447106.1 protein rolling stone isoform X1 [Malaya genurostris]XP_058447107.1 protein rolling stone isoform X1 [Malaya genurostris]XP_058447108.1 protein rolling stone isoform X1 [Malaya genurostris]XP_058447110.1 protein rolling stone isoform X1 [Malaya genurostris]XP_058447111.1 protein rolling s
MVTKIWRSCFPDSTNSPHHVQRHHFYLCQWQSNTQVGICYLMYRLIVAILFLAVLACSLLDIGRSEPMLEHHYAKWWIYLTHWALLACAVQAWLAALIVTKGLMIDRNEFEWNIHVARESRLHAVYWVVYTIATVYSFIVTIVYWTFVYDPEIHRVDAVNLMVHVLNSVIMLIDLTIVGHPIRLNHAYWTTGIGVIYGLFSVIYYLAGGTDRHNESSIYKMLDWQKPGKSIVICALGVFFVFIVHFICYCLYCLRVWLYARVCLPEPDSSASSGSTRKTSREKVSSITRTLSAMEESQREQFLNPSTVIDLK